jgi:hypothetical protein
MKTRHQQKKKSRLDGASRQISYMDGGVNFYLKDVLSLDEQLVGVNIGNSLKVFTHTVS